MHQIYIITEQIVKKIYKRLKIIVNVRVSSSINTASQLKKKIWISIGQSMALLWDLDDVEVSSIVFAWFIRESSFFLIMKITCKLIS